MAMPSVETERAWLSNPDRAPWFTCVLHGPEFRYSYVNDAYARCFGQKNFIGHSVYTVMPELKDQVFFGILKRVYQSGETHIGNNIIVLGDSDENGFIERRVEYTYAAICNQKGVVCELVAEGRLFDPVATRQLSTIDNIETLGLGRLSDTELLSLFMEDKDARQSRALMTQFGSLRAVFAASADRLRRLRPSRFPAAPRLPSTLALRLRVAKEIHRRILRRKVAARPIISSSHVLHQYLLAELGDDQREQFRVMFLDSRNGLITDEPMWEGTVTHCTAYPREILRRAIELSASAIILVHNHPSRATSFSRMDRDITHDIVKAAGAVNLEVHDHLLVAGDYVLSLRASGRWPSA